MKFDDLDGDKTVGELRQVALYRRNEDASNRRCGGGAREKEKRNCSNQFDSGARATKDPRVTFVLQAARRTFTLAAE